MSVKGKQRFAGYRRVSTDEQADPAKSLADQADFIRGIVERLNGDPKAIDWYGGAESAMGEKERAEFTRLLRSIEAKKFGALVVDKLDRLTREPGDHWTVFKACDGNGVALYIGDEPVDFDNAGQQIGLAVQTMSSHYETRGRLDRSVRGRVRLAALGFPSAGGPPFGRFVPARLSGNRKVFESDPKTGLAKWKINADAKRYVQHAAALYLRGKTWQQIAEDLTWPEDKKDIPLDRKANAVRRRVLAAGSDWVQEFRLRRNKEKDFAAIQNRDRVRFEGGKAIVSTLVPALLDAETIEKVRAKAASSRYVDRASGETYALSRFLRCERCGSALGVHTHEKPKGKNPGLAYVQHHPRTRKEGCPGSFGNYQALEANVLFHLSDALSGNPQLVDAVRAAYAAAVPEREELEVQRTQAEAQLRTALKARDRLRRNLTVLDLDEDDAKALSQQSRELGAEVTRLTEQVEALSARIEESRVPRDIEAAVAATVKEIKSGFVLSRATRERKRQAIKALFGGYASLRNKPENSKRRTPSLGVFLHKEKAPEGDRVVWQARGLFGIGATVPPPGVRAQSAYAMQGVTMRPEGVASFAEALSINAKDKVSRRSSGSGCHGTGRGAR